MRPSTRTEIPPAPLWAELTAISLLAAVALVLAVF